jgi:hypothetical protein
VLVTRLLQCLAWVSINPENFVEIGYDWMDFENFRRSVACFYILIFIGVHEIAE